MKILIYIAHPAQFHFYKHIIKDLQIHGHKIKILMKSKDIIEKLLREENSHFENVLPEGRGNHLFSMFLSMLKRDYRVYNVARTFKPDLFIGSDTCMTHIGWLFRRPSLVIGEDDYSIVKKLAWMMMPFSSVIISPEECNMGPWEQKKIPFPGYMKLAYLHPDVFTPDPEIVKKYINGKYCLIRTVLLSAHHDLKVKGLSAEMVKKLIILLESKGISVFIDSENLINEIPEKYRLKIKKSHIHHLLAYSELVISDSQSMSVEAAMLGIPSVRINDFAGRISVLEELEHTYGLTYGFKPNDENRIFEKVRELLESDNLKENFQHRRNKMLSQKINVKAFMVWFIENYPQSRKQLTQNSNLVLQFKQNINVV